MYIIIFYYIKYDSLKSMKTTYIVDNYKSVIIIYYFTSQKDFDAVDAYVV